MRKEGNIMASNKKNKICNEEVARNVGEKMSLLLCYAKG